MEFSRRRWLRDRLRSRLCAAEKEVSAIRAVAVGEGDGAGLATMTMTTTI